MTLSYRWVVVAIGALMTCVGIGAIDTFNAYTWLYIGSMSVALGAVGVALAFPPLPLGLRDELQPA